MTDEELNDLEDYSRLCSQPATEVFICEVSNFTLAGVLERLRAAESVCKSASSAEHMIYQHLGPYCPPIINALAAWRKSRDEP